MQSQMQLTQLTYKKKDGLKSVDSKKTEQVSLKPNSSMNHHKKKQQQNIQF